MEQTAFWRLDTKKLLVLAGICIITFFCYQRTLHNQFSNWDDDVYVSKDTVIQHLNWQNLKIIFTEDITKNNYHPLCMLSLAINYHFSQLNPESYYLTNIIIHIANTVLVFFLFLLLAPLIPPKGGKIRKESPYRGELGGLGEAGFIIASLGSLWFGIHPLHVESVSWIAERKDVLYTFFYLLGLIAYIWPPYPPKEGSKIRKAYPLWGAIRGLPVFIFFILSCLSKPMAVVFPLSLLAIDFLKGNITSVKTFVTQGLRKWPYFLAALVAGGFAVYTQNKTGAIAPFSKLTWAERTMYASYGFVMYIEKLFCPNFLSTFYPYPYRYTNGNLPNIYYIAPWLSLAILIVPAYFTRKRNSTYFHVIVFGLAFFLANVIFVLQFISCGAAIMADRYSYVSSIGILFIVAFFVNELIRLYPSFKIAIITLVLLLSTTLGWTCYQRTAVWHNAETLLTDAVKKYPYQALLSYKWLGNYYMDVHDTDKALASYSVLAQLNAADAKIYDVIGNIYRDRSDYKTALGFYNRSLQQENVFLTYADKAMAEAASGDSADARRDYLNAIRGDISAEKRASELSFNMVQQKKYKPVIAQYNIMMTFNPNNPYYYFYRGCALFGENDMQGSIKDFTAVLRFKDKEVSKVAAYNLVVACDSIGDEQAALNFAAVAKQLGSPPADAFIEKIKRKSGHKE